MAAQGTLWTLVLCVVSCVFIGTDLSSGNTTSSNVTAWARWSPCSVSCGTGGLRQRSRNCTNSAGCSETLNEKQICSATIACASWSSWGPWNTCSVSCGGGISVRERRCIQSGTNKTAPLLCGGKVTEILVCNPQICQDTECGRSVIGSWPWQTSIEFRKEGFNANMPCWAVLVDKNSVLTTAICAKFITVAERYGGYTIVTVGDAMVKNASDGVEVRVSSADVVYSPDYSLRENVFELDNRFTEGEYAIIQLNASLTKDDGVNHVCLADFYRTIDYSNCKVYGFGYTDTNQMGEPIIGSTLMEGDVKLQTLDFCNKTLYNQTGYPGIQAFNASFFCVTNDTTSAFCMGDESAILICLDQNYQFTVVGLARWDPGYNLCEELHSATVFFRVDQAAKIAWIRKTIQANN